MAAIGNVEGLVAHCAVLDYELGQETCDEVALRLMELSVPIVFHTGSSEDVVDLGAHLDAAIVGKPSKAGRLVTAVVDRINGSDVR